MELAISLIPRLRHDIASAFRLNGDDMVGFFGQEQGLNFLQPLQTLSFKSRPIYDWRPICRPFALRHRLSPSPRCKGKSTRKPSSGCGFSTFTISTLQRQAKAG
jgi:hypothetical protein